MHTQYQTPCANKYACQELIHATQQRATDGPGPGVEENRSNDDATVHSSHSKSKSLRDVRCKSTCALCHSIRRRARTLIRLIFLLNIILKVKRIIYHSYYKTTTRADRYIFTICQLRLGNLESIPAGAWVVVNAFVIVPSHVFDLYFVVVCALVMILV